MMQVAIFKYVYSVLFDVEKATMLYLNYDTKRKEYYVIAVNSGKNGYTGKMDLNILKHHARGHKWTNREIVLEHIIDDELYNNFMVSEAI